MLKEIIGNYVNKKREIKGLSINALATNCKLAEGTVKNICLLKADNPEMKTMIPIMDEIDGSFDEMLHPEKFQERISGDAIVALMSAIRETNGEHVHDIRTHYEQHREDVTKNMEMRLADKREIIDMQNAHIAKLEKTSKTKTKIIIALSSIFIVLFFGLFMLEMLHPEHGWIRF